jgi:hypothetical protein
MDDALHPQAALRAIRCADVRSGILPAQSGFRRNDGVEGFRRNDGVVGVRRNWLSQE